MPSAHLRRQALLMLVLCTALWALSFPAMKTLNLTQQKLLPDAGSWFASSLCVMYRFLFAGGLLLIFSVRQLKTISRRELEQGIWLGFFAASGICLQMDGLAYVSASTSAFLTQTYCVLIPLWVAVSSRRWPSLKIIFCSAMVLFGMAVLVRLNPLAIRLGRGEIETLASSVVFAAQILCLEQPRYAGNRPQCFTAVMLLASGLFAVPIVAATAPSAAACLRAYDSIPACGLMAVLVLFCTIAAFLWMNRWQREVTATEAGLIYCVEPVLVSVLALWLPGWLSRWAGVNYANEEATLRLLVGGGLITIANVLLQARWLEGKRNDAQSLAQK
jgi:drug/metabolite transporter (DMT)-like permease